MILDDLIQNAGPIFQRRFADEPLLERLRIAAVDPYSDEDVKKKCSALFRQWAVSYKSTPGMDNIAVLYKQLPQRKKLPSKEHSKVLKETETPEDEGGHNGHRHSASISSTSAADAERRRSSIAEYHASASKLPFAPANYTSQSLSGSSTSKAKVDKKSKKPKQKSFNLEKEKEKMKEVITSATVESTNLNNALKHINREKERVSDNPTVKKRFEICKQLRRETFRYCSLVEDETYLGTLLIANDSLSDALLLYETLDRSFDYDSDSEDYDSPNGKTASASSPKSPPTRQQMAGLTLNNKPPAQPPRPAFTAPTYIPMPAANGKGKAAPASDESEEDEDDENDPFADRNEVSTPQVEKSGMTWCVFPISQRYTYFCARAGLMILQARCVMIEMVT